MAPRLAELPQSKLPTSHSAAPVAHGPHLCPRAERLCAATRAALVVVGCYCCRSRSYTMTTNQTHCETVTAPCATCTPAPTPGTRVAPIIRARRVTAAKSRVPSEPHGEGQLCRHVCTVCPGLATKIGRLIWPCSRFGRADDDVAAHRLGWCCCWGAALRLAGRATGLHACLADESWTSVRH